MWAEIKEVFFTLGSVAGVLALGRPLLEDKMRRDQARIQHILDLLQEDEMLAIEFQVWHPRSVPDAIFRKLSQLFYEIEQKRDAVRFSGPTASYLAAAAGDIVAAYQRLRKLIQVPEWEPRDHDGETFWDFNKRAFENEGGIPEGYAEHLDSAAEEALAVALAFQRFQIVSEMHLYEVPFARWLLARRIKAHKLKTGT